MKKKRKKKNSTNKLIVSFCLLIIVAILFALAYSFLPTRNNPAPLAEVPLVVEKESLAEKEPTETLTPTPAIESPKAETPVVKNELEPSFTVAYKTFELEGQTYNIISNEELFKYMKQSLEKIKNTSTVFVKESLIEETGAEDTRTKIQTVREISIDYSRYFVKQIVEEKLNDNKPTLTEEIYHTKDGLYNISIEDNKEGEKNVKHSPHKDKVSRENLIDSALINDTKRTPYHLVDSLTTVATLPVGAVFGENENSIVLVKKSEEKYFGTINSRYEVYTFDKKSLLPTRYFEFQNLEGTWNDYTAKEIIYNEWNKLKSLKVPDKYLEASTNN